MKRNRALVVLLAMSFMTSGQAMFALDGAPESHEDWSEWRIEELLFMPVTVASTKALTPRESPGIVTVITREEIENSGARDMVDVLTLLAPGFQFGLDLEQHVGLGIRGLWAFEGKALVMVDGIEINEGMYGTAIFGNHYPVGSIEKVEIIRGPGSAIYGGYAGAGVINIITKGASMNRAYAYGLQSQMETRYSHSNAGLGIGKENKDAVSYSLTATKGNGYRSQREVNRYSTGAPRPGSDRFDLDPEFVNANVKYKGLDVRVLTDRFSHRENGEPGNTARSRFYTYAYSMKYDIKATANLTITPKAEYKIQWPWHINLSENGYINDKMAEKQLYSLSALWDATARINMVAGVDYFPTSLKLSKHPDPSEVNTGGTGHFINSGTGENLGHKLDYEQTAVYGQAMVITKWANLTVGARHDNSTQFGDAFSPRLGLTKVWNDWHMKVMAARSFRSPGGIVPALELPGQDIRPETGTSYEAEVGWKISDVMWWVVNGFDSKFKDLIVYGVNPVENYQNIGRFGTRGFETEFRYLSKPIGGRINYAYHRAYDNETAYYSVGGHKDYFLGFAPHRVNALVDVKLTDTLSVHPSASYIGSRYALTRADPSTGGDKLENLSGVVLAHVNMRIRDLLTKGLELDLGVRNILDVDYSFINPYPGNQAPQPADNRAYVGKLIYTYKF
ncbi:MAG: TonB-dependent receptor plug domain-containing protein [Elusimicrobia bacterium]|nr:TonB-dependent receptor plug domain-containing protein [Elusimicrobiota bacterium]